MGQEHGKRIKETLTAVVDHSLPKDQLGHIAVRMTEAGAPGSGIVVALLPTSNDQVYGNAALGAREVDRMAVLFSRAPEMRDMLLLIDSWLTRFGMEIRPDGEIHQAVKKVLSMVPAKTGEEAQA